MVGLLLAAAQVGVESLALAIPDGPFEAVDLSLGTVVRAEAQAAGKQMTWAQYEVRFCLQAPGLDLGADGERMLEGAA